MSALWNDATCRVEKSGVKPPQSKFRAVLTKGKLVLSIGIKELLDSGVHFGHQTRRWNPKMKPFIFDARNGIHIIDLSKTLAQLEAACDFLTQTVRKGGRVLFVGTKKQAQQAIKDVARECGQFYVTERWLGGTMTNFNTLKRSIARLKEIEKMDADGTLAKYGKQEQAVIRREAARLHKYFDGIREMDRMASSFAAIGKSTRSGSQFVSTMATSGSLSLRASATALCSRLMSTTNIAAGILSIARMPSKYFWSRPASRRMTACSCLP